MSTNDREIEELLLKGLTATHVWRVKRVRNSWASYTYRQCLKCDDTVYDPWLSKAVRDYWNSKPCLR